MSAITCAKSLALSALSSGGVKVKFSRGCDWDGVMDGKFPGTLSSRPIGAARSLETALSTRFG